MAKINCNDGCLDNYSAECVKYTGTSIPNPSIPQNTNLNSIINILVNTILSMNSTIEVVDTFADIDQSGSIRFIQVQVDETNSNEITLYWWNGTNLNWVPTQTV